MPFHLDPPDFSKVIYTTIFKVQCNVFECVNHAISPTNVCTGADTATGSSLPSGIKINFEFSSKKKIYGHLQSCNALLRLVMTGRTSMLKQNPRFKNFPHMILKNFY